MGSKINKTKEQVKSIRKGATSAVVKLLKLSDVIGRMKEVEASGAIHNALMQIAEELHLSTFGEATTMDPVVLHDFIKSGFFVGEANSRYGGALDAHQWEEDYVDGDSMKRLVANGLVAFELQDGEHTRFAITPAGAKMIGWTPNGEEA